MTALLLQHASRAIDWLNHAAPWRRSVWLDADRFRAPSFDRLLALWLHRLGWMGREENAFLARAVRPGMTVLDIGANQGIYTVRLSRLVGPAGRVYAFEPDPVLFAALQENCQRNGCENVELHRVALGAARAEAQLHRSLFNSGDNRLSGPVGRPDGEGVAVHVVPLSEVVSADTKIDFAKIDVQGWELEVLRGMEPLFAAGQAPQLFLEYWPEGLRRAGAEPAELVRYLGARGYSVRKENGESGAELDADPSAEGKDRPGTWAYFNLVATRTSSC